METVERRLVELAQAGKSESFGELYHLYINKIYNFIYYKTQHRETAEDLVSLVFTKALENIKNFKNDSESSFQGWLYQIARNTVIDFYRTNRPTIDIEDVWDLDLSAENNLLVDLDNKIKLEEVHKYLQLLKPTQRDIIIMRVWQEMSYQEIADVLNQSEASCKMAFSRALRELKTKMPLAAFVALLLFYR